MAILLISIIVWGIVGLMLADSYCRKNEKNALNFLVLLGGALTIIGFYNFEAEDILKVSIHDWMLFGLFPIFLINIKLRMHLAKIQSETVGEKCSITALNLSEISNRRLVSAFYKINIIMWIYVFAVVAVNILDAVKISS